LSSRLFSLVPSFNSGDNLFSISWLIFLSTFSDDILQALLKNHNDRVCMEDDIKETVKDLSSACKMSSENVDKNINQEIENKLSPELKNFEICFGQLYLVLL
jgi:hypothetical protein